MTAHSALLYGGVKVRHHCPRCTFGRCYRNVNVFVALFGDILFLPCPLVMLCVTPLTLLHFRWYQSNVNLIYCTVSWCKINVHLWILFWVRRCHWNWHYFEYFTAFWVKPETNLQLSTYKLLLEPQDIISEPLRREQRGNFSLIR